MTKTPEQQTITNHTRVTVGLAVTVLIFMVGGLITGIGEWDATRAQIMELQKSQWTITDQLQWTYQFKDAEPQLQIPIPQVSMAPSRWPQTTMLTVSTNAERQ
jgi:hypothetical protein